MTVVPKRDIGGLKGKFGAWQVKANTTVWANNTIALPKRHSTVGSDRKKRKCSQLSNEKANEQTCYVKRPKVSAECQGQMGAIDGHNHYRQSGKGGTASLEKVCVTRDTKDRIFINTTGWVLINAYLAKKKIEWGGIPKKTSAEVQGAIALALINNQWL